MTAFSKVPSLKSRRKFLIRLRSEDYSRDLCTCSHLSTTTSDCE